MFFQDVVLDDGSFYIFSIFISIVASHLEKYYCYKGKLVKEMCVLVAM